MEFLLTGRICLKQEFRQFLDCPDSALKFPVPLGPGQGSFFNKGQAER